MKKNTYLYLENYTYLKVTKLKALLKNTLTGASLLIDNENEIKTLTKLKNSISATLRINKDENIKLLNKIRNGFFGDFIESSNIPIQIQNILPPEKRIRIESDRNIYSHLEEITIFIDTTYNKKRITESLQYDYYICNKSKNQISSKKIIEILETSSQVKNKKINICGGNIFAHPEIQSIIKSLDGYDDVTYHFHISDINAKTEKIITKMQKTSIIVDFQNLEKISHFSEFVDSKFIFLIKSPSQLQNAINIIKDVTNPFDYRIVPIIDDIELFYNYELNIDVKDLLTNPIKTQEITMNSVYNSNYFSKLFIFPNLYITGFKDNDYINSFNSSSSIKEAIAFQIDNNTSSWRLTRRVVSSCKNCIFTDVCPPISNYEISFNHNNLCNYN